MFEKRICYFRHEISTHFFHVERCSFQNTNVKGRKANVRLSKRFRCMRKSEEMPIPNQRRTWAPRSSGDE